MRIDRGFVVEDVLRLVERQSMEPGDGFGLTPGSDFGSGKAVDRKEDFLSVMARLNEIFITDGLSAADQTN